MPIKPAHFAFQYVSSIPIIASSLTVLRLLFVLICFQSYMEAAWYRVTSTGATNLSGRKYARFGSAMRLVLSLASLSQSVSTCNLFCSLKALTIPLFWQHYKMPSLPKYGYIFASLTVWYVLLFKLDKHSHAFSVKSARRTGLEWQYVIMKRVTRRTYPLQNRTSIYQFGRYGARVDMMWIHQAHEYPYDMFQM
jgi:hypothetical protein